MTCSTGWGEWCQDCELSVCCKEADRDARPGED
jgi:hypothetical protein